MQDQKNPTHLQELFRLSFLASQVNMIPIRTNSLAEMKTPGTGQANLRKGRCSVKNQAYMVTWVTLGRTPTFLNFEAARVMINTLRFADEAQWSHTYAYVLMPDHVHWLFQLTGEKSLSSLIGGIKQHASRRLGELSLAPGRLWQKGFYDHAIRQDEDLVELSRYIVANPLRAGLCSDIGEYPHWDAVWMNP